MLLTLVALALAADPTPAEQELKHLTNVKQLTSDYVRAGEAYFSPDGKKVLFQAEEKDTGNPFYQIFLRDMETGAVRRVSPGAGKTTCAAFHPTNGRILFASSHLDPDAKSHYQPELDQRAEERKTRTRRRYSWDFDPFMEIFEADADGGNLKNLTNAKGYDAEGSYSADGKSIVFCSNRDGGLELYIMDADGKNVRKLTNSPNCYNGGPFFSPDGKKVIFRSDRKEKDRLQLYVINSDGTGEKALTANDKWVYWAPFWYKDNRHIIYTAADHSDEKARPNYDLYWMDTETGKTTRLTFATGADVLPVFSPDYKRVMWTSSRGGTSQVYTADFTPPAE